MPKVSENSGTEVVQDLAVMHRGDLDGYEARFVSLLADADLAPLPENRCLCPHWGYVFKGTLTWRYADRVEVTRAGDAFYIPLGHTHGGEAGAEFLPFSPAEQMAEENDVPSAQCASNGR
jgi:hypothetical protein